MTRDQVFTYAVLRDPTDRFSESVLAPFDGARTDPVATRLAFPQPPGGLNGLLGPANDEVIQDENAFQIRVQAPDKAGELPVVILIPGGGFTTGTGNSRWFTAPEFVETHQVILVTMNYRLGILGHHGQHGHAENSQKPLRDLVNALKWVRQNIVHFGGNADNVTLAGESAGAWYAYALSQMPAANGLFAKLALFSLPYEPPLTSAAYADRQEQIETALPSQCGLSQASTEQILKAQQVVAEKYRGKGMPLMPAAGADLAPNIHDFSTTAANIHVDQLLLLTTADEVSAFLKPVPDLAFTDEDIQGFARTKFEDPQAALDFVATRGAGSPKTAMVGLMTLFQFRLAQLELAEAFRKHGAVTTGLFSIPSTVPGMGSPHCMPLPYILGNHAQWFDAPMFEGLPSELFNLYDSVQNWFVSFVKGTAALQSADDGELLRWDFDGSQPQAFPPAELALKANR